MTSDPLAAKASLKGVAELRFKGALGYFKKSAVRNDDDVEPWGDLVAPKDIPNHSLRAIPDDRSSQFLRGGNTEPSAVAGVLQDEQRGELRSDPTARTVDTLEVFAPKNPFRPVEGAGSMRF